VVHLRPSGNAPELRVYAEAADETTAKALIVGTIERIGQDQG
jgi:phosphomannomutase